jgi:glyoxylase-like metal-dependent hydrolase (beta-lactamase superfamily II)
MDTGGIAGTNCFVVADELASECVLFDAPDHTVGPLLDQIRQRGWRLKGLWLTHGHFDHLADHQVVTDAFPGTPILIHKLDEPKLLAPTSRMFPLPFVIPPGKATAFVEDGQVLTIGALSCRVLHTPGHAPGHVAFVFEDEKLVIGGDLIIGSSIGRYDLPDSDATDLAESVRKVMQLPDDARLLGGHGPPTTIGETRQNNEAVRMILGLR